MHRLHRDRLAREARKPRRPFGADRRVAEARSSAAGHVADRPDADHMLARFSRLPAEQREVLALVVLEGLLYTEIADVLDVPVATVMSRLHSAREAMRSMTAGSEIPPPTGR